MSDKTLTRADLAEAVYREVGLSRQESADLVQSVLGMMSDSLSNGQSVKLSSFGSFLLFIFIHSIADHQIGNFENDEGQHSGISNGGQNTNRLYAQLRAN